MTIEFTRAKINEVCLEIDDAYIEMCQNLVLFVGHAHSGHSIIGSILDCHPNISIANEVNIVKTINDHNLTREEALKLLLFESVNASNNSKKWLNSEYQYDISNEQQGVLTQPVLIGDKKGGGTTRILLNNPTLIHQLIMLFEGNLKIIFVKRNPIDIVSAYSYYMKQPISQFHVDRYIENMEYVLYLKSVLSANQFTELKHENFIINPVDNLVNLFGFLNIDYDVTEIDRWTSIVQNNIRPKSDGIAIPKEFKLQLSKYLF